MNNNNNNPDPNWFSVPESVKILEKELRAIQAEAAEMGEAEEAGVHLVQP